VEWLRRDRSCVCVRAYLAGQVGSRSFKGGGGASVCHGPHPHAPRAAGVQGQSGCELCYTLDPSRTQCLN